MEQIIETIEELDKIEEGDHFSLLEEWIEGGTDKLPEEMLIYLKQLELIRGFFYAGDINPRKITRKLQLHYPDLSIKQCRTRIDDARVYFYLNEEIKKDFYRRIHYEQQMQMYKVTKTTAKTHAEMKIASDILKEAGKLIELDKPDKETLPEEFFIKPNRFFSLKPSDIGLPDDMNRNEVGNWLDKLQIAETEKFRLKQDLGSEPRQIFDYDGEEDDHSGE
ncbi:hypothetical protein JM79_3236 [Gramella sp. Hel_I_59]|uniref:hypothetical protein n=1 Tax=Gramella sp. Hel_I_59 TaxID=1249978 RepID=UPI00114DECAB|nr:hypothetical protein [Gramella sp. Hel_I_59]TQI72278.1 hypothetical protein JM79_3236 [Gramella sp. Hel_I_59]